jgi:hypothetical protein
VIIPSESTFSRVFAEFATGNLRSQVHDALVKQYLAEELVGHISRDSTAIAGREKPVKKVAKEARKPCKRGCLAKGEQPNRLSRNDLIVRFARLRRIPSVSCRSTAIVTPRRMPMAIKVMEWL